MTNRVFIISHVVVRLFCVRFGKDGEGDSGPRQS